MTKFISLHSPRGKLLFLATTHITSYREYDTQTGGRTIITLIGKSETIVRETTEEVSSLLRQAEDRS